MFTSILQLIACSTPNCHNDDVTETIKKLYSYNAHPQIRDEMQRMYHKFGTYSADLETQNQRVNSIQLNEIKELSYAELKEYQKIPDGTEAEQKFDDADYICIGTMTENIPIQSIKYTEENTKFDLKSVIKQNKISVPIIYTVRYNENNDEDHIGYTMNITAKKFGDFDLVRILLRQSDPKYKNAQIEISKDTF